ncbi:MAG: hypothetical protein HRU14_16680, partial [Planctomycetes bacterium]|nr:hypothetical protein [Planctomycetota bacterium]
EERKRAKAAEAKAPASKGGKKGKASEQMTVDEDSDDDWDTGKGKKGKKGKQEAPAPEPVPEAFIFVKLGGRRQAPTRVTKFLPPVPAVAQPTRVVPNASTDVIDLSMAFPIKFQKRKAFVVQLRLKLEPGAAARFK